MTDRSDFIVVDTEGSSELSEISILDSQGTLIYEAFSEGHPSHQTIRFNLKPLPDIIQDFIEIARNRPIVCHHANHDIEVLKYSFARAGYTWRDFSFVCTWELSKQFFPNAAGYSLEFLCKHLSLKVRGQRFNPAQAHTARYDAEFTHQLYLKILEQQQSQAMQRQLSQTPNPFSSSRVDTPFQEHLDLQEVYHSEFESLKSIIGDIKNDPNQQSKGAVVIGEAGSGKTHLMMRLARELLRSNRLLFIRHPNHADSVLYHTYARILESFAEKVPGSDRTQLELLIARSFIKILRSQANVTTTQKGQEILAALENDQLSLYNRLGIEGTDKHRNTWQYIDRQINLWWTGQYTAAGYGAAILKGIIKFCSYNSPRYKELVRRWLAGNELEAEETQLIGLPNWQEDLSREEFALAAIAVFGRLSTLDEPLLIIFDQLESLGLAHNEPILASFGSAVKELLTHVPNSLFILNLFPDRWQQFQGYFDGSVIDRVSQYTIYLNRPSADKLRQILSLKAASVGLNLEQLFSPAELNDILSQPSIRAILNRASAYFRANATGHPLSPSRQPAGPSLEERVQQLETVLQQIASLIGPLLNSSPSSPLTLDPPSTQQPPRTSLEPLQPGSPFIALPTLHSELESYLQQQQAALAEAYNRPTVLSDADDIGKLATIAEAFKTITALEIDQLRLGKTKLPEHLWLKTSRQGLAIAFLQIHGSLFTSRIKNFNQLVITYPSIQFQLLRDAREPQVTGQVGKQEIQKLNHTPNGKFVILEADDRIKFELIYKLITDIEEKDLDIDLKQALLYLRSYLKNYWLISFFSE